MTTPVEARFWAKVEKTDTCWLWVGSRDRQDYGKFRFNGTRNGAHRYSYELHKGPIPDGLQIDHLCRNTPCVNPDHLKAVPPWLNNARSLSPSALNMVKTHCPEGHVYDETNTYLSARGNRRCRPCQIEAVRRYRARRTVTDRMTHGKRNTYDAGCRCDLCTKTKREQRRATRRRALDGGGR